MCKKSMCIFCGGFFYDIDTAYFGSEHCICNHCTKTNPVKPKWQNLCNRGLPKPNKMDHRYIHNLPSAMKKLALEVRKDYYDDRRVVEMR